MNTRRVNAAAGILHASMQLGKSLPAALAYDLEAAGLLQSPEVAAELVALRDRVAELEAAQTSFLLPWAHGLDAKSLDNFVGDLARAADAPLMFVVNEIHQTVARWRELVAQQPAAAAAEDVTPQVQRLRDLLAGQRAAVEDPHDSPLHHAYTKGRDFPEARRG